MNVCLLPAGCKVVVAVATILWVLVAGWVVCFVAFASAPRCGRCRAGFLSLGGFTPAWTAAAHAWTHPLLPLPRSVFGWFADAPAPADIRNKLKFLQYLKKKTNTNPKRGPIHERAPSHWFKRVVKSMLPKKKRRSTEAQTRLKAFEGVPPPYDKIKLLVVPDALRVVKLDGQRVFTSLGKLASQLGWKHAELISRLETVRKEAAAARYTEKKAAITATAKAAAKSAEVQAINAELATYGF